MFIYQKVDYDIYLKNTGDNLFRISCCGLKFLSLSTWVLIGQPLKQAALAAGFGDQSHMYRSYKELLGIAPSQINTYKSDLEIISCHKYGLHQLRTDIRRPRFSIRL